MKNFIKNLFIVLPDFTILLFFFLLLIPSFCFFINIPVGAWQGYLAFVVTIISIVIIKNNEQMPIKMFALSLFGCIGVFLFSGILSHYIYDSSFDGQWYHQEMIIALYNGWNPVYDAYASTSNALEIIVNHYPKGIELIQAIIYSSSGSLESGKLIHIVCIFITYLFAFEYLQRLITNIKHVRLISFLIAMNPIALVQITTFYIDGIVASLFTILTLLFLHFIEQGSKRKIILIIMVSTILCTVKFTLLPYCAILGFASFVFCCSKKRWLEVKYLFVYGLLTVILSLGIIGYNPYVKNIKEKGEIFYPLKGENAMDIVTWLIPENFKGKGTLSPLMLSLTSQSEKTTDDKVIMPKIPFSLSKSELLSFSVPDTKIGGFGPFFGWIFLFSVITSIVLIVYYRRFVVVLWLLVPVIISVLIIPQAWWARYVPQMWWIPIIVIVLLFLSKKKALIQMAICTAIILCLNCAMIFTVNFGSNVVRSMIFKKKIYALKQFAEPPNIYFGMYRSNVLRFREHNINFVEVMSKDRFSKGNQYYFSREVVVETSASIRFYKKGSFIDALLSTIEKKYIKNE